MAPVVANNKDNTDITPSQKRHIINTGTKIEQAQFEINKILDCLDNKHYLKIKKIPNIRII